MKREIIFSVMMIASLPVFATKETHRGGADVAAVCKCGEGCDCLRTNDTCPCGTTKAGDKDEKEGGCGGVCGKNMQVCQEGCDKGACTDVSDQDVA